MEYLSAAGLSILINSYPSIELLHPSHIISDLRAPKRRPSKQITYISFKYLLVILHDSQFDLNIGRRYAYNPYLLGVQLYHSKTYNPSNNISSRADVNLV